MYMLIAILVLVCRLSVERRVVVMALCRLPSMFWLFISSLGDMASPRIDFLGQFGSRDPHLPYYNVTGSVLTPGTVVFTGAREVSSSEVLRNVAFVSPPLARSWARAASHCRPAAARDAADDGRNERRAARW